MHYTEEKQQELKGPYIAENDTDVEGISYEDFRRIWGDS
jgi:hypothetical protein